MDPEDDALERAVTRQLYRLHCPDPQVLGDFYLGTLDAGREEVEAHLQECSRCRDELATLERFLRIRDRPDVRVLVAQWWPALRVAEAAPAYAVRGSPQLASATYRAGELTLHVSITEDPQDRSVRTVVGILSSDAGSVLEARARLVGASYHGEAEVDAVGQFVFDAVPPGRYTLEVETDETTVQVYPLDVG